jgi:hypothetical protein
MEKDQTALEELARAELMRLNALVSGILTGMIAGLLVFLATNILLIRGGDVVGPHLNLLGQFFIGYQVSFGGSLIGFAYAFVGGFLVAYAIAWMYNWLVDLRDGRRPAGERA